MPSAIIDPSSTSFLSTSTFDIIIIGGGTSGIVVATRLSSDPSLFILVLEAGSNNLTDPRIITPGLAASLYDDPEFDWCFMSTPQEHLCGRQLAQPKGKTLGGSTAINLGMVIYPSKADFNGWETLGNKGWNWEVMAPYLRAWSTLTLPSEEAPEDLGLKYVDVAANGTKGPVQISFGEPDAYTPFNKAWPKIFQNLGLEVMGDPISGTAKGAFTSPGIVHPVTKARSHAGADYLSEEVLRRPNLCILTEVLVEKIIIEKPLTGELVATGVKIATKDGKKREVLAKKEVILVAGTIKSPQLLELSGIGNDDLLKSDGIDVLLNNPNVGENLQDHGYVPFSWEVADDQVSGDILRNPEVAGAAMAAYANAQAGPLSGIPIVSAFMPLVDLPSTEMDELLQKNLDSVQYKSFPSQKKQFDIVRETLTSPEETSGQYTMAPFKIVPRDGPACKGIYGMGKEGNYISIVSVLNYPLSRGFVHLSSPNATAQPTVDPKYFSHPLDLELHGRHVLWLETLAATEPMASLLKKPEEGRQEDTQRDGCDGCRNSEEDRGRDFYIALSCRWYMRYASKGAWWCGG